MVSFVLSEAPRASLSAFVEGQLREALMSGALRPGQRLNTRELARQLGTSLTPVREALLKLVAAGALDAAPAQAFQVPVVTRERYREIATIRKSLEGLAVDAACGRIDADGFATLDRLNEAFRAARADGRAGDALKANREFRFALYGLAGMPALLGLIEQLWMQIGPCFNYLYPQPRLEAGSRHNHDVLLEALRAGDGRHARAALEQAIDDGTRLVMEHFGFDEPAAGRQDPPLLVVP